MGVNGENQARSLASLQPGQGGVVFSVKGEPSLRRRVLEMGLVPGTTVRLERRAPLGGPISIWLRGYELSLRLDEAEMVLVCDTRLCCCCENAAGCCASCKQ